jgi:hypothetical protein
VHEPASLQRNAVLGILAGRSITYSPAWLDDGASVLFDRNSGDYWVVSLLARELVARCAESGDVGIEVLIRHVMDTLADTDDFDGSVATVEQVVAELVQLGVLAQTRTEPLPAHCQPAASPIA